jgi:hypothetical protein
MSHYIQVLVAKTAIFCFNLFFLNHEIIKIQKSQNRNVYRTWLVDRPTSRKPMRHTSLVGLSNTPARVVTRQDEATTDLGRRPLASQIRVRWCPAALGSSASLAVDLSTSSHHLDAQILKWRFVVARDVVIFLQPWWVPPLNPDPSCRPPPPGRGRPCCPPHLLPSVGPTYHRYPPSTAGGDSRPQSPKPRNPKIDSLLSHKNNTTNMYNKNWFSISPGHGCCSTRRMPASTRRARAPPASTPGYAPPPPGLARQVVRRAWPPRWAPGLPRPWIHTHPYPARGERTSVNWMGKEDRREGEDETGGRGTSGISKCWWRTGDLHFTGMDHTLVQMSSHLYRAYPPGTNVVSRGRVGPPPPHPLQMPLFVPGAKILGTNEKIV